MAKIICMCNKAHNQCDIRCDRGRQIKPDKVYQVNWPKKRER